MKKTIKIFSIILMVSIFVLFLSNTVLASGASGIMSNLKPNYDKVETRQFNWTWIKYY